MTKRIGLIGLGKMGRNMAIRLVNAGWEVAGNDASESATQDIETFGAKAALTVHELVAALPAPRLVWVMVPAGKPVDDVLTGLKDLLQAGDIVIDGGNTFYEDTLRHAAMFQDAGIGFLDVGTSGGPGGALNGACLMIGGAPALYKKLDPLWRDLAQNGEAYKLMGQAGAGHYVKMIHNGIEYGMMQALAEGANLLKHGPFPVNLADAMWIYDHGSVIESRLVGWAQDGFRKYGEDLAEISGTVGHTGEGEWTVKTAEKLGHPVPVIKASYQFRVDSAAAPSYVGQVLSMLRNVFGGHAAKK